MVAISNGKYCIEGDMTSSALSLLNRKLPPYAINCPLSSGFDEIEVLCSMDSFIVSEKWGISIEKIKSIFRGIYM